MSGRHLSFPFKIGSDGRTATPASIDDHVKGELVQLLLTSPGERPFLPGFGGGLRRLVFEGNSDVTAALSKATITQALNRWLSERIEVTDLTVESADATLTIGVQYRVIATGEERRLQFEHQT